VQSPQNKARRGAGWMRLLVNEGNTPTVLFGLGDMHNTHHPDEFVPVDDLTATLKTLALTAAGMRRGDGVALAGT
jgi:acetylornithine deacetylase/succinyl-diaminopimelate desuccinylase-like protein